MSTQVIASYTYGVYGELLSGDSELTRFLYNGRYGVKIAKKHEWEHMMLI